MHPVKTDKVIRMVGRLGYVLVHTKGSHHIFKNGEGKRISIPVHAGKMIGKGLLLKIIKNDLGLTREEFLRLLDSV